MVSGRETVNTEKGKDVAAKKAKKAAAKEEARREREEEAKRKKALVEERRKKREREEAKEASEKEAKRAKKTKSAQLAKKNSEAVKKVKSGKTVADRVEDDDNSSSDEGTVNLEPPEEDGPDRPLTVWEKLTGEMREVLEAAGFPESTCNRMSHNEVCRLHAEIRKQRAEEAKELGNIGEVVKRQEEKEVRPREYDQFVEDAEHFHPARFEPLGLDWTAYTSNVRRSVHPRREEQWVRELGMDDQLATGTYQVSSPYTGWQEITLQKGTYLLIYLGAPNRK